MNKNKKRWYELGEWFNRNKLKIIALTISVLTVSIYMDYFEHTVNNPKEVTYREYINDLEAGMDLFDKDGNLKEVKKDKIDTVYYDLSTNEWRYTLWNDRSRDAYNEWLSKGLSSASFEYDYNITDWRKVKVYSTSSDKMKEHIDQYDGICCRMITRKSFQPFYSSVFSMFGSLLLTLTIIFAIFGIYAKKLSNMGGLGKNLLVKDTGVRFKDVIGHDEIIDDLKLIVELMKNSAKKKDETEKNNEKPKFNADIPRGMLFSGEAGTGKTMLAKAVAGEAGVPFLYMNASGFVEMYVGVGARRVRDLFKMARKHSPCIIFIDEIDAVGADRNSAISSEQKQTIDALLPEMDGFDTKAGIFVIAATNNPDSLDKALVRSGRFDRQVVISPPRDYKVRMKLFEQYLKEDECNADLETIAKECVGVTGADINTICNEARLVAIAKKADTIDTNILEEAIDRKIFKGNHLKNKRIEEVKIVAHHEAGHALTSILLGVPIVRATIIGSTGGVGGAVFRAEEVKSFVTRKDVLNQVMIACGGRAAEEIMYGKEDITTGASNDIQQVTMILKEYVSSYGFDDNMVSLSVLYEQKLYSEYVVSRVSELANKLYNDTVDLLTANKDKLLKLAESLIEKETMSGDEIYTLLGIGVKK